MLSLYYLLDKDNSLRSMNFCGIRTDMHYMQDIHIPAVQELPRSTCQKIMHMRAYIDIMYVRELN